jgi:hypothetical protein
MEDEVMRRLMAQNPVQSSLREGLLTGTLPRFAAKLLLCRTASASLRNGPLMVLGILCN